MFTTEESPFVPRNGPEGNGPLVGIDADNAIQALKQHAFPRVNRRFVDPIPSNEPQFALFSYIRTPDSELAAFFDAIAPVLSPEHSKLLEQIKNRKAPVYGTAKIRGAFHTVTEAAARAEEIIRNVDSTNSVFTCKIGVPFPLVVEGCAEETTAVDLQNTVETALVENIKQKRQKERREMEEIKEREAALRSDVAKDPSLDDLENYITNRVKLAHLRYAIDQHHIKREEALGFERDCITFLLSLKDKNPSFESSYMDKYLAGRKAAGVSDNYAFEGFMGYMAAPLVYREAQETV
jgi:hypothetical protein